MNTKKSITKITNGKWKAIRVNKNICHVYYGTSHFARLLIQGRQVQYSKGVPFRKVYYLNRFIVKVIKKIK